jgi:hypothetical protein
VLGRNANSWIEVNPSGRRRAFRFQKLGTMKGVTGTIVEASDGSPIFFFIPDTEWVQYREIYDWFENGPWNT